MITNLVVECFKAKRVDDPTLGSYYIFPARMVSDHSVEKFVNKIEDNLRERLIEMMTTMFEFEEKQNNG